MPFLIYALLIAFGLLLVQRSAYHIRLRAKGKRIKLPVVEGLTLENRLNWPFSLIELIITTWTSVFAPDTPKVKVQTWNENRTNCHAFSLDSDIKEPLHFGKRWLQGRHSSFDESVADAIGAEFFNMKDVPGPGVWSLKFPEVSTLKYRLGKEGVKKVTLWNLLFGEKKNRHLFVVLYSPKERMLHSLRLSPDGKWVHKQGGNHVSYVDSKGNAIKTPRRSVFDVSYLVFGYYWKYHQ